MEQLELYVPKLEDLWFYQKMMSDPETMSYNANWDVNYDGYHRDTGCVDYPDAVLPAWYENMVGQEPERFYAYIKRSADGAWIGDVNFHYNPAKDWWDMGIVLYAPYRGKGYAVPALKLMLEHAFRDCGISEYTMILRSPGMRFPHGRPTAGQASGNWAWRMAFFR